MQNPFRSEAQAFRLVVATLVYFGLIAVATIFGGTWAGLAVFLVLTAGAAWWLLRGPDRQRPAVTAPPHRGPPGERRILVVANEAVGGSALRELLRERGAGARTEVLVVSPALNTPLRHWASDEDDARAAAQERLESSVARLRQAGLEVRGEVGDADPLQATEDALRTFGADELVIATHPEGRSEWLERGVVTAARERFALPITHVVVDPDADREEVR